MSRRGFRWRRASEPSERRREPRRRRWRPPAVTRTTEEEEAAVVAAPPPPPAPSAILDPRPLAPLNVFFRMPTQSDRLL